MELTAALLLVPRVSEAAMANVSDPALRQWAEDLKDDHNECAAQPSLKLAAMSADPPSPLSNRSLLRG